MAAQVRKQVRETAKFTFNAILKLPIFIIFTVALGYLFYHLGSICSVGVIEGDGVLRNLINPFLVETVSKQQILYALVGVTMLLLVFMSAAVKEYASSAMSLFFLAGVSYVAGLFSPNAGFLDIGRCIHFLFTPEYYLAYFVVALVWGLSYCFVFNRTYFFSFY